MLYQQYAAKSWDIIMGCAVQNLHKSDLWKTTWEVPMDREDVGNTGALFRFFKLHNHMMVYDNKNQNISIVEELEKRHKFSGMLQMGKGGRFFSSFAQDWKWRDSLFHD